MEKTENHAPATGIVGTILGSIGTAGALAAGGMGLMNGGNGGKGLAQENADLRSQVAELKAQKYTDGRVIEVVDRISAIDARQDAMDQKLEKAILQNKADIETNRVIAQKDLEIAILKAGKDADAKINAVATAGVQTAGAVAALQAVVAGITKTVIPQSAVCETAGTCCGGNQ